MGKGPWNFNETASLYWWKEQQSYSIQLACFSSGARKGKDWEECRKINNCPLKIANSDQINAFPAVAVAFLRKTEWCVWYIVYARKLSFIFLVSSQQSFVQADWLIAFSENGLHSMERFLLGKHPCMFVWAEKRQAGRVHIGYNANDSMYCRRRYRKDSAAL